MPSVGFEPTISVGERPKTYAVDRAATGTGKFIRYSKENMNEVTDGILGGCRMNCTCKSKQIREMEILPKLYGRRVGLDSSVGVATEL
jgi:hypothetical protein